LQGGAAISLQFFHEIFPAGRMKKEKKRAEGRFLKKEEKTY
jgi:hypothetical protein